ncbi:MAG TPA: IclR family transcriptional regulator [Streptosporangiaceae bacterium]|jgi:DNA-binding IclR family transcriptional regulator
MAEAKPSGAETARRTLRLLEALAARQPIKLDPLAGAVGLTKSTTYRLLRVLQEERYAERLDSGGYRLGPAFFGLAGPSLPGTHFYESAAPIVRDLAAATEETVTLHRRVGDLSILVHGVESGHALRQVARVGEACPLTRGCSALAILAYLSEEDAGAVLARTDLGAEARAALETRLAAIRGDGYAFSHAENHPGVAGISAPIRLPGAARNLEMSMSVSGPDFRWTRDRAESFRPRLAASADALARHFAAATA